MSRQQAITSFFTTSDGSGVRQNPTTSAAVQVAAFTLEENEAVPIPPKRKKRVGGLKPLPPAKETKKVSRKSTPPNRDGFHSSHENPRSGVHFQLMRIGSYKCLRPEIKEEMPHGPKSACTFTVTNPTGSAARIQVYAHCKQCWPNFLEKKRVQGNESSKRHKNTNRRSSTAYVNRERDKIVNMQENGLVPTIPCTWERCNTLLFTTIWQNIENHRKTYDILTVSGFFEKEEWKTETKVAFPDGQLKHLDFKQALRKHLTEQASGNYHQFNAEMWHTQPNRSQSTVLDFIRDTGKRAFQLCALRFGSLEESTDQESIFQMIGWTYNTTENLLPGSVNYNIINQQPEGKNWLKLPEEEFDLAIDNGKDRIPLICFDNECSGDSHGVRGKFFGQLHRNDVELIPFKLVK